MAVEQQATSSVRARCGCSSLRQDGAAACRCEPFDIAGELSGQGLRAGLEQISAAGLATWIGLCTLAAASVGDDLGAVVRQGVLDHRDRPALVAFDDANPAPRAELVTPGPARERGGAGRMHPLWGFRLCRIQRRRRQGRQIGFHSTGRQQGERGKCDGSSEPQRGRLRAGIPVWPCAWVRGRLTASCIVA